jgi:hypothetical protein
MPKNSKIPGDEGIAMNVLIETIALLRARRVRVPDS